MFTISASFLDPCKRCFLRLNFSKHGLTRHLAGLSVSTVPQPCPKTGYAEATPWSWIRPISKRCHSTEHAPKAGYDPPNSDIETVQEIENESLVKKSNDSDSHIEGGGALLKNSGVDSRHCSSKTHQENGWQKPEGFHTGISIFNSLTRKKEPLILPNGRIVSWYQCGPTVYDNAHIGHASAYIRTDIIRRVLMNLFNIDVVLVMGITDIDDKIIRRAKELRYSNFMKMTQQYEANFFRDLDNLKVLRPTVKTRVTDHMPHIVKFIQQIIENGYAYKTPQGNVYFDVNAFGRYGKLWTHSMSTEIREAADKEKKSARDFALWKAAKPDEPFWESPFGTGRPGWHIECSTMASAVFGPNLDIHSGGDDLRFPHHENEMAQSEACFCCDQWTNYWVHTGPLHLRNDHNKMSKSLNNTMSIYDLLQQYTPNQFRLFCMLRPYRNAIEYSDEAMLKAVRIHSNWAAFLNTAETYIRGHLLCKPIDEPALTESLQYAKDNVEKALADDFDFPRAVHEMEMLIHKANIELTRRPAGQSALAPRSTGTIAGIVAYVERIMDLFGIEVSKRKMHSPSFNSDSYYQSAYATTQRQFGNVMDSVVKFRKDVRQFALESPRPIVESPPADDQRDTKKHTMMPLLQACDDIREDLKSTGIQVVDHGKESSWDMMEKVNAPEPSQRKT